MKRILLCSALAALVAGSPAALGNVLINGDFSTGDVGPVGVLAGQESLGTIIPNWNFYNIGPGQLNPSIVNGQYQDASGVSQGILWQSAPVGAGPVTLDGFIDYAGADMHFLEIFVVDGQYASAGALPFGLNTGNPSVPHGYAFKAASWGPQPDTYSGTMDQLVALANGVAEDRRGIGGLPADFPSGFATLVVRYGWGGDHTGTLILDNLVLTPEPAAALLLLAGLPLMRRRRA